MNETKSTTGARVVVLVALLMLSLPLSAESTEPASISADAGGDYVIGMQDLLEIRVFELDELSQTVRVAGDGYISLPLLGRTRAAGLTKANLEAQIAERLEDGYVLDAQVTVFVQSYESKKVAISGAVKAPGRYEMLGPMSLLDMISEAGGLEESHGRQVVIFRAELGGGTRRLPVDLRTLVVTGDPEANLRLEPGDVVYVAAEELVRIFVGGAVNSPNMFEVPSHEPVTVLRAITLAGGMAPRAAEKKVQVIRTDAEGQKNTITVNYRKIRQGMSVDPILRPDDVVFVQQSFF
jgi:polysaccharide export outer membrane protein